MLKLINMKTLIIIPTYNEKDNIKNLIDKIFLTLKNVNDWEILFVDDNSKDGTKEIIQNAICDKIHLLQRTDKLGLASAYIDGIKYGIRYNYDAFIQMDADFSHNPKYLVNIIEYLKNSDLVIASRNVHGGKVIGWSLLRTIISKGGSLYSRIILNCPITDLTGGFNGWKKDIIEKINLNDIISKGYCFQIEMKYRAYKKNAKIKEFPIIFEDRKFGKSKMNKSIFFEAFINVIRIRFLKLT